MKYPLLRITTDRESDEVFEANSPEGEITINPWDIDSNIGHLDKESVRYATKGMITLRSCSDMPMKAFYLDGYYDWVLSKNASESFILIPMTKKRPYPSKKILTKLNSL